MKFQLALLVFFATFLAVSSKGINLKETAYNLQSVADKDQQDQEPLYEDYQLVEEEQPASELADVDIMNSQAPEPYRRCWMVRCFPRRGRWRICLCIRYK